MLLAAFNKFEAQMLKQIDDSIVARAKIANEQLAKDSIKNIDTPLNSELGKLQLKESLK